VKKLVERFKQTQAFRAWTRFGNARGNVLASGIAYYGFFSIFPAVAIAAVIFGFILRGRPELLASVADSLNQTLPNFVKTADNPNGLVALKAPAVSVLTIGGLVAAVSLILSGVGWIGAMRDGIRAIFGVPGSPGNLITDKLRDLGVLALLGVGVFVTGVLTSILGSGASGLAQWVGMGRSPLLVTVVGLIVGFVVDVAVMVLLLRFLSGVPLPWHDVRKGAIAGGIGLSVIRMFGVQLVNIATRNPVFGSIVLVIGLLFWLNLIARIILLAASLAANDIDDHLAELEASSGSPASDEDVREHQHLDLTDERSRVVAGAPAFGARTRDRASLAAGAVLGATVAFALGSVGRTIRSVFSRR
jgi:membrane protein